MSILIIDNYDSFTFNLFQMIQGQTSAEVIVKRNDALTLEEIKQLAPTGIVLSPGPGHPANAVDFGVCADVIRHAGELNAAVLGVCLGHQGIAQHLGGKISRAPRILHGKRSLIRQKAPSKMFDGMTETFTAMRYHSLIVSPEQLPSSLEVTATDDSGDIMALQHRELPMFGLQFHPESIGTPDGARMLRNFIELC
jgi:anthranilate synthase component 2